MLQFANGGRLVQASSELPDLRHAKRLFLDFETSHKDPGTKGLNAYKGAFIAGVCITVDDAPGAWYVPVGHHFRDGTMHPGNIDPIQFQRWLKDVVTTCEDWINHNVKFDAHFAAQAGAFFQGRLIDTITLSKLIDSDRLYKGGYGLDALSKAWLEEDISGYEERLKQYLAGVKLPRNRKAQAYGLVPPDILGEYGCQDVLTNRRLYDLLLRRREEDLERIWEIETKLTPVLWDIEREGMHVDRVELQLKELEIMEQLIEYEEELHKRLGFGCNPANSSDCFDLLCNFYGLPVLSWNDDGNPSFDKDALKQYLKHPDVSNDSTRVEVVERLLEYRKLNTLLTFFVRPYQEHEVDGVMHPDYNQSVRSGRNSCKRPNAQQLSKEAKLLIHPPKDCAFLSLDYSQVEFRMIVHFIQDIDATKAYLENPDTDFHTWVAEVCGIQRSPAKNINFAIGFGAGKRKITSMLSGNMDLMESQVPVVDAMIAEGRISPSQRKQAFDALCKKRAEEVFNLYHSTLPTLKQHTKWAAGRAASRGYVRTAYGRRCHLPQKAAHIAFNRVVQGSAADLMKERVVAIAPRYNPITRALGLRFTSLVHDELLFVGPRDLTRDPRVVRWAAETIEDTAFKFRVPIRASAGWSDKNWAIASGDKEPYNGKIEIDRTAPSIDAVLAACQVA